MELDKGRIKMAETIVVPEKLNPLSNTTTTNRVKVLEIIQDFGGSAGLKDIATHLGAPMAATLGYLNWLIKTGYVTKTPEKPVKYVLTETGRTAVAKPTPPPTENPVVEAPPTHAPESPQATPKAGFWTKLARIFNKT
jgi:DNA-binding MarR family transcriptional regulator